ncbi:uncharacterized protein LOC123307735 isoform X1 [Coccinella septempunctata]|uniref:uncharacterized protein LOC123307735 isoform X1 n=1 Tax=Coccinella septempunctata TaxID=41139 RepID=UPI001D066B9E|nr:uncharacterized protein LOC123307735 isoform X1 [Coccinella septempunctata]
MLVGLNRKWKQPIAYYFTHKSCSSEILRNCLFDVIKAVTNVAKLDIVATICDMGVNNVKCLKELGVTTQKPYFIYGAKKIFIMYDVPHLLKRTYALFRKYNVFLNVQIEESVTTMEAKFSHVRLAYEHDKASPYVFRSLHKLKDNFFDPIMKYAMKVNIAAQVMSRTVSAYLYSMIRNGAMQQECIATASFLMEVDTLFDSFNGNTNQSGKELKCNITENSPHNEYWPKALQMVKSWKFKRLSKSGQVKQSTPPSQMGWITSLNAIRGIWAYVHSKGFTVLRPRSLNQDPLENLFGCIRYGSGCNDNPSAFQFVGSLKAQILNNLIHCSTHSNCEKDNNDLLSNLKSFLEKDEKEGEYQPNEVEVICMPEISTEETVSIIEADVNGGRAETFSVAYVAGFILKGIYKKITCTGCSALLSSDVLEAHNMFIWNKEWSDDKRSLYYPSVVFTISIAQGITSLENFMVDNSNISDLPYHASKFVHNHIDFSWLTCEQHCEQIETITVQSIVNIGIVWWVKRENQKFKNQKNAIIKSKKLMKMKNM